RFGGCFRLGRRRIRDQPRAVGGARPAGKLTSKRAASPTPPLWDPRPEDYSPDRDSLLREPCEASPPLRPACAARLRSCEKLRFSLGTLAPPLRAISR